MCGSDVSPLEKWREIAGHLEERKLGPMNKDEYLASIVAALERADLDRRLDIDYGAARRLAHSCYEKGFLLSPVEKAFLSIAVYPSLTRFSEDNVEEKRFHNKLWREATASLPRKYYPAVVEILFFIAGRMDYLGLFEHGRDILAMTTVYITSDTENLHYHDLRGHMDSRERHPSTYRPEPPTPLR